MQISSRYILQSKPTGNILVYLNKDSKIVPETMEQKIFCVKTYKTESLIKVSSFLFMSGAVGKLTQDWKDLTDFSLNR